MSISNDVPRNAKSAYERYGWCRSPKLLNTDDIRKLRTSIGCIAEEIRPEIVYENGTRTVRALHGCHLYDDVCSRIVRLPFLVGLVDELIGEPVYVYQFKVNVKQAREGAAWPWHQDFAFWSKEDGHA